MREYMCTLCYAVLRDIHNGYVCPQCGKEYVHGDTVGIHHTHGIPCPLCGDMMLLDDYGGYWCLTPGCYDLQTQELQDKRELK